MKQDHEFKLALEFLALTAELKQTREDAALVVHALSAAVQLIESLIAWMPEGTVLPNEVAAAKGALSQAMDSIRHRENQHTEKRE